jgi:hypothetical protein
MIITDVIRISHKVCPIKPRTLEINNGDAWTNYFGKRTFIRTGQGPTPVSLVYIVCTSRAERSICAKKNKE